MTDTKRQELLRKAEDSADSAKFKYEYAITEASSESIKKSLKEQSQFYLNLSRTYTEILKTEPKLYNNDNTD